MALALCLGLGFWYASERAAQVPAAALLVVLLFTVVLLNRSAHESAPPVLLAAHQPGAPTEQPRASRWQPHWLAVGLLALLGLVFVSALADLPGSFVDPAVLVLAVVLGAVGVAQRRTRSYQRAMRLALRRLAPVWAMPYNGSATFHLGCGSPTGNAPVTRCWRSRHRPSPSAGWPRATTSP